MNEKNANSPKPVAATKSAATAPVARSLRENVLEKLRQAGATGVPLAELDDRKRESRALLKAALDELIAERKIARVEEGRRVVCFLASFAPTIESVRQRLEQAARDAHVTLLSKEDLQGTLAPVEREFFTPALVGLLAEKKLIKLSHASRVKKTGPPREAEFYLHAAGLRELVSATFPTAASPTFTPRALLDVYRQLVQAIGFSDVEVFELHQRLGIPLPELKAQILAEREAGRAVLSFGDWSLASPETRSGAIEINGDRYLRVRFQEEWHGRQ